MASFRSIPLSLPSEEYDRENEQTMRRTIELALQDIESDVLIAKTQSDKPSSLAMRRFQFLLMGAS